MVGIKTTKQLDKTQDRDDNIATESSQLSAAEVCVASGKAVETGAPWKLRETQKAGFPQRPQPLEIARAIPTFPPPRRSAEKWKTKQPVSHFPAMAI